MKELKRLPAGLNLSPPYLILMRIGEGNVWLEGIGNLRHPLLNVENSLRDGLPFYTVISVTRGSEVLYSHTPAGIADISTAKDADGPAYDIQGRPVPQDSKHGFIIKNGRKMWRK